MTSKTKSKEPKPISLHEVIRVIQVVPERFRAALAKSIVCSLAGHSRVVDSCFGQITCGRCGEIVGDTLMGSMKMDDHVILQHDCKVCRKNYKAMGWRDKYLTPNPFTKPQAGK